MHWQVWVLCSLRIVYGLCASLLLNTKQMVGGSSSRCCTVVEGRGRERGMRDLGISQGAVKMEQYT